jgi:DNA-binding beta-propeller fold protein YncE
VGNALAFDSNSNRVYFANYLNKYHLYVINAERPYNLIADHTEGVGELTGLVFDSKNNKLYCGNQTENAGINVFDTVSGSFLSMIQTAFRTRYGVLATAYDKIYFRDNYTGSIFVIYINDKWF